MFFSTSDGTRDALNRFGTAYERFWRVADLGLL
jgi:hypothetical protein